MNAETIQPWHEMERCEGELSNFDRTIDEGVEEALRTKEKYAQYSAWDFCGHVWFDGEQFKCDVWRYRQSVDVIAAPTLPALMDAVSDEYGYD